MEYPNELRIVNTSHIFNNEWGKPLESHSSYTYIKINDLEYHTDNHKWLIEVNPRILPQSLLIKDHDVDYFILANEYISKIDVAMIEDDYNRYFKRSVMVYSNPSYNVNTNCSSIIGRWNFFLTNGEFVSLNTKKFYVGYSFRSYQKLRLKHEEVESLVKEHGRIYDTHAYYFDLKDYKKAAIQGVCQKLVDIPYKENELYCYTNDEAEAAAVYLSMKKKEAAKIKAKERDRLRNEKKGKGNSYKFYSAIFHVDKLIREHLREKYNIFRKYDLSFLVQKHNFKDHLQFAYDLKLELDPKEFKEMIPFVDGIIKSKNEYYEFVMLAKKMKLL